MYTYLINISTMSLCPSLAAKCIGLKKKEIYRRKREGERVYIQVS